MNRDETCQYLTDHGVCYERMDHPAVYNMEEIDRLALPHPEAEAKNLFVRDDKKKNYYLITVKSEKRVDLKAFSQRHGLRKLSFASAEELAAMLELTPGSVSPLGLLNDAGRRVTLYLDAAFCGGLIGIHPNENTATVWLQTVDLVRLLRVQGSRVELTEL